MSTSKKLATLALLLLGMALIIGLISGAFRSESSVAPPSLSKSSVCQSSLRYRIKVAHQIEGKTSLPIPTDIQVESELILRPVAGNEEKVLYQVDVKILSAEGMERDRTQVLSDSTAIPTWISLENWGKLKIWVKSNENTQSLNSLRTYLYLTQAPPKLQHPMTTLESDDAGALSAKYSLTATGFQKSRTLEGSPNGAIRIRKSDWQYEGIPNGLSLKAQESREIQVGLASSTHLKLDLSGTIEWERRSGKEEEQCAALSADELIRQERLVPWEHRLKLTSDVDLKKTLEERVKEILENHTQDRYRKLQELTDYLQAKPEEISKIEDRLLTKSEVDDEFIDLLGALASVRSNEQTAAMRRLMSHFRNGGPLLEKVLRTQQLSMNIAEQNLDLIWELANEATHLESRRVALYSVGTAIKHLPPSEVREEYLKRLSAKIQTASPKLDWIAAVGNAGAIETSARLIELTKVEESSIALEAVDALRLIPDSKARARLLNLVEQSRDLEMHDRAVDALRYQSLSDVERERLRNAADKLPSTDLERRNAILSIVGKP